MISPCRHGHNLLSKNTVTWRPARGTRQHRTPAIPPKLFTRNPVIYFPEVDKTCVYVFGRLPGFIENLLENGNLFCSATGATKTALGVLQLCFNYFALSFFNELGIHSSWEDEQRDTPVVGAFTPVSLVVYGMIDLPIFRCPSETPWHLTIGVRGGILLGGAGTEKFALNITIRPKKQFAKFHGSPQVNMPWIHYIEKVSPFRIFEQLALALKIFIVLKIFFTIQDFWATLRLPWKTVCPEFTASNIYILIIDDFWATCACPEIFQTGGGGSPFLPVSYACALDIHESAKPSAF